jgi:type II secretory pathway pseudopilin PulG
VPFADAVEMVVVIGMVAIMFVVVCAPVASARRKARPVRTSTVRQHLAKLRLAGLVQATPNGRRQTYSVGGGHGRRLVWKCSNRPSIR